MDYTNTNLTAENLIGLRNKKMWMENWEKRDK